MGRSLILCYKRCLGLFTAGMGVPVTLRLGKSVRVSGDNSGEKAHGVQFINALLCVESQ